MNSDIHPFFLAPSFGFGKICRLTPFSCGEFCRHFRDHQSCRQLGLPRAIGRIAALGLMLIAQHLYPLAGDDTLVAQTLDLLRCQAEFL